MSKLLQGFTVLLASFALSSAAFGAVGTTGTTAPGGTVATDKVNTVSTDVKDTVATDKAFMNKNVVSVASEEPELSTFVSALKAADLTAALQGTGPFTIFAPSNAAFDEYGKDDLVDLLKPENKDELVEVLTYHIVPGKFLAKDVKAGEVKSLNGQKLDIKIDGTSVTVDGAKIVRTDLVGSNGVIHIIDEVLDP